MNQFLKKSLLGAAFLSATLLAGCRGAKTAANADNAGKQVLPFTQEQAIQNAKELYAKKDVTVTSPDCSLYSLSGYIGTCDFAALANKDDGIIYRLRFNADTNKGAYIACAIREASKPGEELGSLADKAFQSAARAKFTRLGFTVGETLNPPVVEYSIFTDGLCGRETNATFLMKQDGTLYTGAYRQTYSLSERNANPGTVGEISALGKQITAAPAASVLRQKETPVTSAPARNDEEYKPPQTLQDNLCFGSCVGPHVDLSTGKIEMFSAGPGYKF